MDINELKKAYNRAIEDMGARSGDVDALDEKRSADAGAVSAEDYAAAEAAFDTSLDEVKRTKTNLEREERKQKALKDNPPIEIEEREEATPPNSPQPNGMKSETTYRKGGRHSFFFDLVHKATDPDAAERLARHVAETRAVTTADPGAAGFIPPVYLSELAAMLPRFGRPFADAVRHMDLPDSGMTLTIPKVQTGTTVAVQATEGTTVSETDIDTTTVSVPVRTIAGQQNISRAALERAFPSMDEIIFRDLISAYDQELDRQLIAGSGSSGQHLGVLNVSGINTVTYTDASPTAAETLPKIYDAVQKVHTEFKIGMADTIVWHPRRSAFMASNLSSTFPLFQLGTLHQAVGQQDKGFTKGALGLFECVDGNIPITGGSSTNEDKIIVTKADELILMEGPLRTAVYEGVGSATLSVRLQVFAFSAFVSARYPEAISVVSGTGLVTPTF